MAIVVVVAAASFFAGLRTGSLGLLDSKPSPTRLATANDDLSGAEPAAGQPGDAANPLLHRPHSVPDRFVTRAEYARFAQATGHIAGPGCHVWSGGAWRVDPNMTWRTAPEQAGDAVTCVSARDAEAFLRWRSQATGRTLRLPLQSEWRDLGAGKSGTWSWTAGCWSPLDCDYRAVRQGDARLRGHVDLRAANIGFRIAAD